MPRAPLGGAIAKGIQATSLGRVDGTLYIITASLVQPDFGTARPKGPSAPIVIIAMEIDEDFLADFADRFMLGDIHIHPEDSSLETYEAHASFLNNRGVNIGTLDWYPRNPGEVLLGRLGGPILVVIVSLAGLVLFWVRRSLNMACGLVESEARATHLAFYDSLTGLPNRVLLADRLRHTTDALRRTGTPFAVHCIDLDRFKEINDTYGHHVGDELIQQASRRMAALCRLSETFGRLSGDEFAIIQPNVSAAGATALADRLCCAMAEPFDLSAGRVFIGCSVGITIVADHAMQPAEALRQGDLALYRAKEGGKGQFCFFELEMDAAIKNRRVLEADLRDALSADRLRLVYQPQVNGQGYVTGVEALARWLHPDRGEISPSYFVPVAEQCGLIMPLGLFTLRRAFEDSRRWPGLKVAINVSARQIRMNEFIPTLRALVAEMDVDPKQFELEITESILLGDEPDVHARLAHLRAIGFSLALDDFGTGYSSLSYLRRYPINKIKIDRSFITGLGADVEAEALVSAIVKLARALSLSVIAEGVETATQLDYLTAAGCSDVQGYLFSRPVDAVAIDAICAENRQMRVPQPSLT